MISTLGWGVLQLSALRRRPGASDLPRGDRLGSGVLRSGSGRRVGFDAVLELTAGVAGRQSRSRSTASHGHRAVTRAPREAGSGSRSSDRPRPTAADLTPVSRQLSLDQIEG